MLIKAKKGGAVNNQEELRRNSLVMSAQNERIEIKAGYAYSRVINSKSAITLLSKKFSAFARGAQYSQLYQRGLWDGKESMINKKDGSFGTGLLPDVVAYLNGLGAQVDVDDLRTPPEKMYDFSWINKDKLRGAQVEGLGHLREATNGIIKMATGTGKSRLFCKLIQELGVRTLVCVHSKELMHQTVRNIEECIGGDDVKIGMWGDGRTPNPASTIVVAMYPTLVSNRGRGDPELRAQFIETMGAFELLVCDECHKVCSNDSITKTWETIMDINAYYRFAFSATPFEKENTVAELLQRSAFGHIIYDLDAKKAKDDGYITPFDVYFIKPRYSIGYTSHGTTGMTYNEAHDYYIGSNMTRNKAVIESVKTLIADGRKTMVVAQRIEHNELLAKMLAEEIGEKNVYLLHGQLDTKYRTAALKEFKERKDPCVIVASSVGNTGIDVPDISGIVLAHGGKSFFENVQRAGRGLRLADGKEKLVFIDFDDCELGRWFMNHTKARRGYYEELGANIVRL